MEHIGIDVHRSESQICILTEDGEMLEPRVQTRRDRCQRVLGNRPRARILIEASTENEWVARCLEELGHEVIVADPNFAPMYATRSRRIKTDWRDAQALMDACRLGAYCPTHRPSGPITCWSEAMPRSQPTTRFEFAMLRDARISDPLLR